MSSFRKRKNPIIRSTQQDFRYVVRKVGDKEFVTNEIKDSVDKLYAPSPTLKELLDSGVSPKDVNVNGLMDSYDENDTPIQEIEEKIIKKSKSKKSE